MVATPIGEQNPAYYLSIEPRLKNMQKVFKYFLWIFPFFFFLVGYFSISFFYRNNEIQTPSIVGKDIHSAASILSSKNLNLRIIKDKEDPALEQGTVLSQEPRIGRKIRPNQTVFVTVSKAPALVPAPNLIGKQNDQVTTCLKKQNIRSKSYNIVCEQQKDLCIAQIPSENEPLPEKKIILYKSAGNTKPIIFPNLKGKPVQNVLDFLNEYEIQAQVIHAHPTSSNHTCSQCTVQHQKPLAGSLINFGPEINVQLQVD